MFVITCAKRLTVLELLALMSCLLSIHCSGKDIVSHADDTEFRVAEDESTIEVLSRSKRYLVWNPGSFFQITVALAIPMKEIREKAKNVGVAFDIQGNYPLPTNATFLELGFIPTIAGSRRTVRDLSLQDAYESFEEILSGQGFEGRSCLLQAICMAAEIPLSKDNFYEELVHLLLTPLEISSDIASHYKEAQQLGETGADCRRAFRDCKTPLLDVISKIWNQDIKDMQDGVAPPELQRLSRPRR